MTTQTLHLSLSALNEQVTEAAEPKPKMDGNPVSPGGYWKENWDSEKSWHWVPRYQFVEDVGAILGLMFEKNVAFTIDSNSRGKVMIDVWQKNVKHPERAPFYADSFSALAPALCCAFLFALDGIRRDVVAVEGAQS